MLLFSIAALLFPIGAVTASQPQYAAVRAGTIAPTRAKGAAAKRRKKHAVPAAAIGFMRPESADGLAADLATILGRAQKGAKWGVVVVSLSKGDTLYGRGADEQFLPASTMKLFTSAVALDRFGTRLEKRFTKVEIRDMMRASGLNNIVFSETSFWTAVGLKK